MKKDLLEELIDALTDLRNHQKTINIPLPPKPDEVFRVVGKVAKEHEVTAEELLTMMAMRSTLHSDSENMIAADLQTVHDLENNE